MLLKRIRQFDIRKDGVIVGIGRFKMSDGF